MENENISKKQIPEIETLSQDISSAIESSEGGFIKKIIHEQEANDEKKKDSSFKTKKNQYFVYIGIALIGIAVILITAIFMNREKIVTLEVPPQYLPLIFSDKNSFLPVDSQGKDAMAKSIFNKASNTEVKKEGIEAIYLTTNSKVVGLREFITSIRGYLDIKNNTFVSDNFLLGVVNKDIKDLFILIKVRTIPDVFADMKKWENKMYYDLHNFWNLPITPDTAYLLNKDFQDGIVQNKNARILYDQDKKIVLMYVFADDESVVIASNEKTVAEVILRLSGSKLKK